FVSTRAEIPSDLCKASEEQQSGCSEDVKEMLLLLLSYFDEKEESMFFHVDDTCLAEEVELGQVPLTPTIIVCGYSSTRYMLSLDRNLVNTNISSFISALWLMFGSYYCFNIHYPSELASTLEFLQSCLEEPLISHGWRRRQMHLRALFNLPCYLPCYLPCLFEVSMSSAGPVNVQNRTPEIPAVQEDCLCVLGERSQVQQTTWRPRTSREDARETGRTKHQSHNTQEFCP
ncbi:hypothetical protein D4764_0245150, partial [Takifugu flavidus]